MSTYVLIHGAWHGGWCWNKIQPLLEEAGHTTLAPDLPGHGEDPTPIAEVTLDGYVDRVCEVIDAQPGPVVLVGHSMGGIVITQTAERRPDSIDRLVYLTAFLPGNGESLLGLAEDFPTVVTENLEVTADEVSATVADAAIRPAFYGQCSDDDVARAKSLLVPQAMAPLVTPLELSEHNAGRVRRLYVECLADQAIDPALQKKMYTDRPCERVVSMHTDHSPFFSAPQELAAHLLSL